jgi:RNA polymerase sigma factor (sigma-70 family)
LKEPVPVVLQASVQQKSAAPEASDEALLDRMRAGESAAGEELVRRHYRPLIRYLHRLTGSETTAQEVHQQTWLSVLEHLDRFDAPKVDSKPGMKLGALKNQAHTTSTGGFKAWLFRIATNKANDHWRSVGREKVAKAGLRLVTDQEMPSADHRMDATEQEQKLTAAIRQLPESQRQVLLLRYYSDLKFVEIAEIVGCPLNTALGRMHKAMLKLKEIMG